MHRLCEFLGVNMDMRKAVDLFLLSISANGYSKATQDLYSWALALLINYLHNPDIRDITPALLDQFWHWVRNDYKPTRKNKSTAPLSGRSLENIWTAERSFFNWCITTAKIKKRPDEQIKKPRYAEREIMPLSELEIARLLDAAKQTRISVTEKRTPFTMTRATAKRDIALIMVLVDTGIRVSECARLTKSDINFDSSEITVQPFGSGRKTKHRILTIGKNTRLALWNYILEREEAGENIQPDDILFVSKSGRSMDKDSIRHILLAIGSNAGIPNVHPHRLRHTFASEAAIEGANEYELMRDLGQSTAKMARRYVHMQNRRRNHTSIIDRIKRKR